jgi:hypothetical protein
VGIGIRQNGQIRSCGRKTVPQYWQTAGCTAQRGCAADIWVSCGEPTPRSFVTLTSGLKRMGDVFAEPRMPEEKASPTPGN